MYFKLSGNIRCASVESGRKLNLLWLKQKSMYWLVMTNKILRVALAPGTAGLNSAMLQWFALSTLVNYSLLAPVVRQNLLRATEGIFSISSQVQDWGRESLLLLSEPHQVLGFGRCNISVSVTFPERKAMI